MSNIDTVKAFYRYLGASEYEKAYTLLHDDFELIQAASLPYGGTFVGKEGIVNFFKQFFSFWGSFRSEDTAYAEAGDQVFATSRAVGKTKAGREINMPMVQIYVLRGSKLKSAQPFYFDTHQFLT